MILTIDLSTCNLIDARLAYLFRCSITVKVRLTTANHYNHTEIEEIKDWRLQMNFFRPIFLFLRIASFIWLIWFKLPTLLEIFQFSFPPLNLSISRSSHSMLDILLYRKIKQIYCEYMHTYLKVSTLHCE